MSNPERTSMTNDPERIMRNCAEPSLLTTFRQKELRDEAMQEPEESIKAALESDIKGPPFKPINEQDTVPLVNPPTSYP